MLNLLCQVLILTLFIKRIENIRRDIKGKNQGYNVLSKEKHKPEELSKTEEQLKTAWTFIYVMWRDWYQEYVEKHKISIIIATVKFILIAKIIKSHHGKNTLTWENRDIIIQDIVQDIEKVNGSQSSEIEQYTDTVLIHFLLYNKRDALSDLVWIDKKKITLEWQD